MNLLAIPRPLVVQKSVSILAILVALTLVPLLYNLPLVGLGLGDLNSVLHFSAEERLFIDFHGQYEKGPLYAPQFDNMNVYPKAYYNLAGIFLYPYTSINGGDFQVVLITWRLLNALAGAGTIVVLFFIGRRVFRSDVAAIVGALLFSITPEFLFWTSSVRPNPLELFLILTTLYICIRLFDVFSFKTFLLAVLLASLSFSTKYGGVIFVGMLPLLALFLIWRDQRNQTVWAKVLAQQMSMIRWALPVLVVLTGSVGIAITLLLSSNGWDPVALILNLSASSFPEDKLARAPVYLEKWRWLVQAVVITGLAGILLAVAALLMAWRLSKKWVNTTSQQVSITVYVFLTGWLTIQVILIYGLAFFLTGPVYIARPDFFVSQVGFLFYYTSLGGDVGPFGQASSFIDQLRILITQLHPGWIGFTLLLSIAAYREIYLIPRGNPEKAVRVFLWVFIVFSLLAMLVSSQLQVRHVLPAIAISSLLIGESVVSMIRGLKAPRTSLNTKAVTVLSILLIALLAGFHVNSAYADWSLKFSKPSDTGIEVGLWLAERYSEDIRLMTDWWTFYIPPQFTNVANTTSAERTATREGAKILESGVSVDSLDHSELKRLAVRDSILSFDPQVIVISHPYGYDTTVNVLTLLQSDPTLSQQGYQEIKRFDYVGDKPRLYEYTEVLVYEKN